ncbi:MAG: nucleotidyltransferase family protein [Candidatus Marsarchaeota archaeon]|jgi:glucose-1-phosphate thymidylyltransferase|nr:nucleotidyltransferase family protein [Candidatus Marsarchaeota archaeon]
MKAIILCGGFAVRLEPITKFIPKPLLPIGGIPLLEYIINDLHIISGLENDNISNIYVSTNHKFHDQFQHFVETHHVHFENSKVEVIAEPTTSNANKFGAIKGILYAIEEAGIDDDLIIIAGDNFYDFSLREIIKKFKLYRRPVVCLHKVDSKEYAKRFGVVEVEGGKIRSFEEKPENPKSTLISTGIYIFPKEMLYLFKKYIQDKNNPDAPGFFIQWLINNKVEIYGIENDGMWFDIGNVEIYGEVFELYKQKGYGKVTHVPK